ncbi:MAG: HD domain-containing phosphohydrolase [Campylobacterota bacterium]
MKIVQKNIRPTVSHVPLDIKNLRLGTNTPFDIFIQKDKNYIIIIEAGTLLTTKVHNILSNQKKLYILKNADKKQKLNCKTLTFYVESNKNLNEKTIGFIYEVNSKLFAKIVDDDYSSFKVSCIESIVKNIIFLIKSKKKYLKESIQYFVDDYQVHYHSLHVAIYAVSLGHFLNFNENELLSLGTAGLLHDLGLLTVNQEILKKDSELDPKEFEIVQQHPKYSVEIIMHNHIHDPYVIDAVKHHHERHDGSGYPDKLYAHQISKFASILAICDVFDALTNNRPHRKKHTYFEALKLMMQDPSMENKFNHKYLQVFLKSLI